MPERVEGAFWRFDTQIPAYFLDVPQHISPTQFAMLPGAEYKWPIVTGPREELSECK